MHNPHAYILCKSLTYVCVVCVRCFNFSVTGQRSNAVTRSYCGWLGANFARFKADYSTVRQYAQLAFPMTGKLEWIGTIICGGPVNRQTVMFPQVLLGVNFQGNWVSTWQLLKKNDQPSAIVACSLFSGQYERHDYYIIQLIMPWNQPDLAGWQCMSFLLVFTITFQNNIFGYYCGQKCSLTPLIEHLWDVIHIHN